MSGMEGGQGLGASADGAAIGENKSKIKENRLRRKQMGVK